MGLEESCWSYSVGGEDGPGLSRMYLCEVVSSGCCSVACSLLPLHVKQDGGQLWKVGRALPVSGRQYSL